MAGKFSIKEHLKIMDLNFEITRMELVENRFGKNDLVIRQVKVCDKNGKYIKFAKLNNALINALKKKKEIKIKGNDES